MLYKNIRKHLFAFENNMSACFVRTLCFLLCILLCRIPTVKAVSTSAVSAIVIETSGNTVIYQQNAYQRLPMASTTKIMTALCAIEAGNIDRTVTVDDKAVGTEGSSIYLTKGEKLTIRELLYGLMLNSGNDAAMAIAYAVSGSVEDFAVLMNQTAQKIGAKNTNFENPSGLDGKNHYTTAYDLAIITSYALKIPAFAEIAATYKKTIPNGDKTYDRQLKNHNKLLNMYDGCTGVKTGFTKKCGRCLVSSAKRGNVELVAVTLNDGDDWRDHTAMLDYGFENVTSKTLVKKGEYIATIPVKGGTQSYVKLFASDDVNVTVKSGDEFEVQIKYDTQNEAIAPVNYGSMFGNVSIFINGKQIGCVGAQSQMTIPIEQNRGIVDIYMILLDLWIDMIYN